MLLVPLVTLYFFHSNVYQILISFALLLFGYFLINCSFNNVLQKKYGIEKNGIFFWNKHEFYKMKIKEIKNEFAGKIKLKEQFEFLLKLIDKQLEELNKPLFFKTGIIGAVLLPVWLQYISFLYAHVNSLAQATAIFIQLITIVGYVLYYYFILATLFNGIINRDYNILKQIRMDVETLYFEKLGLKWDEGSKDN